MPTRSDYAALSVVLVALLIGSWAWADGGALKINKGDTRADGYLGVGAESYRTSISAADSADTSQSTITALDPIYCRNYQVVAVHGRHSVASATVVVHAIKYLLDGSIAGIETFTLTADDFSTVSSAYLSNSVPVDTEGCAYMRLQVEAPSSGNVDLWSAVY